MYGSEHELALAALLPRRLRRGRRRRGLRRAPARRGDRQPARAHERDRERIFNLGYFTWVEQQGVSLEDFEARRSPAFWSGIHDARAGEWDALIDELNARTGVLETAVTAAASRLVCAGCGAEPRRRDPYPFRCPNARPGDDVDHVLRRELDLSAVRFPLDDPEPNPFVRYRAFLHAYHVGDRGGPLRRRVLRARASASTGGSPTVDGHGFAATPFARSPGARASSSASPRRAASGSRTRRATSSGSHKARHLFGVLL